MRVRRHFAVTCFGSLALLTALAQVVGAQTAPITGTVLDSVSRVPIHGVIVSVGAADRERITRTDDAGRFLLDADTGTQTVRFRRLGYQPHATTVWVLGEGVTFDVALLQIATLDTVRVRAARQGIYGVVGAAADLTPISGAAVQLLGESVRTLRTDSGGRFFAGLSAGTYLVRAGAPGFATRTVSVTLPPGDGREVALLLDSAEARAEHAIEAAFFDFRQRMLHRRATGAALVPRSELLRDGGGPMLALLRQSPSFARKALRIGPLACIFVDGRPRPGLSLGALDPAGVEAIEIYGRRGDPSLTLVQRWPRGFPCAETGAGGYPQREDVAWIVIWTAR